MTALFVTQGKVLGTPLHDLWVILMGMSDGDERRRACEGAGRAGYDFIRAHDGHGVVIPHVWFHFT